MTRQSRGLVFGSVIAVCIVMFGLITQPAGADPVNQEGVAAGDFPVRAATMASGEQTVYGTANPAAPSPELLRDLQTYAQANNLDPAAVISAHEGIEEFSNLVTELERTEAATYVRSGLVPTGEADYWIEFTTRPDTALLDRIAALPATVSVRYGAPASAAEIATLSDSLTRVISQHPAVVKSSGTRYDHDRHVLKLEFTRVEGVADPLVQQVIDAGLRASLLSTGELPLPVELGETHGPEAVEEITVQGGRDLNRASDNSSECTGGFTAKRHGNRGMLTARHCPDALRMGTSADAISTNPAIPEYDAVDLQFHRTLTGNGHTTNKQFRATGRDPSADRAVTAVANAPLDSTVCHWGRTSGYSCSSVVDQDTCETFDSGHRWCGLDVTYADISSGGDSGGPWFLGNTARGTHTGATSGVESYFTRVGRLYFLDVTILQN